MSYVHGRTPHLRVSEPHLQMDIVDALEEIAEVSARGFDRFVVPRDENYSNVIKPEVFSHFGNLPEVTEESNETPTEIVHVMIDISSGIDELHTCLGDSDH